MGLARRDAEVGRLVVRGDAWSLEFLAGYFRKSYILKVQRALLALQHLQRKHA